MGMTTQPLGRAATLLFKAHDSDDSCWRQAFIHDAICVLERVGDPSLSPIIERLSLACGNCCDNDILLSLEDRLRDWAGGDEMERAA